MKKKLRVLLAAPVLFLAAVLAIAALRGGSEAMSAKGGSSRGATADSSTLARGKTDDGGGRDLAAPGPGGAPGSVGKQAKSTEPLTGAVISTGQVTLHSASINRARSEVMRLVASWNGTVADEQTSSDDRGRVVDSTMTLRVPTAEFAEAMNALAGLGEVQQQSRKSEDVSTQVIDNSARVRAAERSIRQIEHLLGRAEELSDIIAIESDLARRQADLDSLKSQQAYLADQTSLSTINVYLGRTGDGRLGQKEARGFLAGLDGGWTAMKEATVVLVTVVGAVLPFALVLALLGVPLWLVLRRRLAGAVSVGSAPARSA
jgi:hypothetical protein